MVILFCLMLTWISFSVLLLLTHIYSGLLRDHIQILFYSIFHSNVDNLCHLIWVQSFKFNVIFNMVGLKSVILLFIFYLPICCLSLFPLLCFLFEQGLVFSDSFQLFYWILTHFISMYFINPKYIQLLLLLIDIF